jgi:uncharacterized protein (TIGR02466 family)
MEGKIYPIFPTAVMKFKFPRKFTSEELKCFSQYKLHSMKFDGADTISQDKMVLDNPKLCDIKKFCDECLASYMKQVYNPHNSISPELYITQSWINYMRPGTTHSNHIHKNSLISGSFYISANKKYDMIEFLKNDYNQFNIIPEEYNDYNTLDVAMAVESYDLILFPSLLNHYVPPTTNPESRVSLAFNSFIRGKIGHEKSLSYLNI